MNEITIVRRRSTHLLSIVLTLLVVAMLLLAGLWLLGMLPGVPPVRIDALAPILPLSRRRRR